jgi:hypothetical protein
MQGRRKCAQVGTSTLNTREGADTVFLKRDTAKA